MNNKAETLRLLRAFARTDVSISILQYREMVKYKHSEHSLILQEVVIRANFDSWKRAHRTFLNHINGVVIEPIKWLPLSNKRANWSGYKLKGLSHEQ